MSIIQHYGMAYIYIIYTRVQNHWLCQCIAYHTCTHKGIAQNYAQSSHSNHTSEARYSRTQSTQLIVYAW